MKTRRLDPEIWDIGRITILYCPGCGSFLKEKKMVRAGLLHKNCLRTAQDDEPILVNVEDMNPDEF